MTAPIDEPFAGLDEVWVWPATDPTDAVAVTRIGDREADRYLGRALVRFARGDRGALAAVPVPPLGDEVASPLTALDGWLTAVQHRATSRGTSEAWQLVLDASRPEPASRGLAVVIAALGLVHHPQLVYGRPA